MVGIHIWQNTLRVYKGWNSLTLFFDIVLPNIDAPLGGEAPIKRQTRNPRRATAGIFDDEKYREYMLWCIRYSHMTWLGSPEGEQLKGGSVKTISDFHKILGYRFVSSPTISCGKFLRVAKFLTRMNFLYCCLTVF